MVAASERHEAQLLDPRPDTAGRIRGDARTMAGLIEQWLESPASKIFLRFLTKRGRNGRRAERLLKAYAGLDVELSLGDRLAGHSMSYLLDRIALGAGIERETIRESLHTGYWRKGLASVLEGVAWRGPQKPFTAYCPFLVVWNFTNTCNLRCRHCYQSASAETMRVEMTTEQALDAVDLMAEEGLAYVAMSGGEPLARPDFFQVAERIVERDMGLSVATNGTLLSEEVVGRLVDVGCELVQVSLDGVRETHDEFRGVRCFDRVVEGISNAAASELGVAVSMAVTRLNLGEVRQVMDLAEGLGADTFMHYNFIPVGRGEGIAEMDISPEEREDLLEALVHESRSRRMNVLSTAPQYSRVCTGHGILSMTHFDTFGAHEGLGEEIRFLAEFVGGCGAGRLYWALQPNGDLTPCVFIPIMLGNITRDGFLDVWRDSPVLKALRDRSGFKGGCESCDHRNVCGGCRARAYGYTGDLTQSDPGCIINAAGSFNIKVNSNKTGGAPQETPLRTPHQGAPGPEGRLNEVISDENR